MSSIMFFLLYLYRQTEKENMTRMDSPMGYCSYTEGARVGGPGGERGGIIGVIGSRRTFRYRNLPTQRPLWTEAH